MAELTLEQVFGPGTTQDASSITLLKSNMPGLTASSSNTAESLLVGIVLKAKVNLTADNQTSNPDQSITIADGFVPSYTVSNNIQYRQDDITLSLRKPAGSLAIDPDDY
ncbi:MAG: hypothetical protein HWQ44_03830 [Nostoc sp. JL34]|uniref:hypothetical protein n=1 Tax=Nostoc sp. JL34 TaxID=2815397 RepID=UPI001D58C989|nr:hypothetical protein [Nostoc sp. JL34]MBN3882130.1 hypothetical protein [Nostoc sp. JL34]